MVDDSIGDVFSKRPREYAWEIRNKPFDQWRDMFTAVPHRFAEMVKVHLTTAMERKGVEQSKIEEVHNTYLALSHISEPGIRKEVSEKWWEGAEAVSESASEETGEPVPGQGLHEEGGTQDLFS